ncbi:hypothetical protein SK128_006548 [Halocaridina rubra]|uniref:Uncharacterized protein n=1 Tax=Halocaridina rubra TaxID=373956 RepID=A0AAN8XD62_HALRR
MACTTEYRSLTVTKRKALSSARRCREGMLTNDLHKNWEEDAKTSIASIIKKYTSSLLINGYRTHPPLPSAFVTSLKKNGVNGIKHFVGTECYTDTIFKYLEYQAKNSKTKVKLKNIGNELRALNAKTTNNDKKVKKRVSFGPSTVKVFGESDYYEGEKEFIKRELALLKPRNLKKALRDREKKSEVAVTGRRPSFQVAKSHLRIQAKKKALNQLNNNNAKSSELNKHIIKRPGRPRITDQRCLNRLQETGKKGNSLKHEKTVKAPDKSVSSGNNHLNGKSSSVTASFVQKLPKTIIFTKGYEKSQGTLGKLSNPPKKRRSKRIAVLKCKAEPATNDRGCGKRSLVNTCKSKCPVPVKSKGMPCAISKSSAKCTKHSRSCGRPPAVNKRKAKPAALSKSSSRLPAGNKCKSKSSLLSRSRGRPPAVDKWKSKPAALSKGRGRPPAGTKCKSKSLLLSKSRGRPLKNKHLQGKSPALTKCKVKPLTLKKYCSRPKLSKCKASSQENIKCRGRPPNLTKHAALPLTFISCHGRPPDLNKHSSIQSKNAVHLGERTGQHNFHTKNKGHKTQSKTASCGGETIRKTKKESKRKSSLEDKMTDEKIKARVNRLYAMLTISFKHYKKTNHFFPYKRKRYLRRLIR